MEWTLKLEATSGPDTGTVFQYEVRSAIVFGRNGAPAIDGRLPTDAHISRAHLNLAPEDDGVRARSAKQGRSFLVDGVDTDEHVLRGGEALGLGSSSFRVAVERMRAVAHPPRVSQADTPVDIPSTTNIRIRHLEDFELLDELGQGAMGRVISARDEDGQTLCVKLVRNDVENLDEALHRFFAREIDLLGALEHPNIVRTLYAGRSERDLFLAMEWIEGATLAEEVAVRGPLSLLDTCSVGRQVLSALICAHERSVVHRDIKPDNVMLRGGRGALHAILIDFGLARIAGELGDVGITATGEARGSIGYSALEALKDAKRATPAADLFGVGATLYFALTGGECYDPGAMKERLMQVIGGQEVVPLVQRRSDVPSELASVIERSLAVEPEGRWASAKEMLERLVWAEGAVHRQLASEVPD